MEIWSYLSSRWIKPLFYYLWQACLSLWYIFCLIVFFCLTCDIAIQMFFGWCLFLALCLSQCCNQYVGRDWSSQGSVGESFQEPSGGFTDCWPLTLAPSHMNFSMRAAWNLASVMASPVISCSEWSHLQCCKLSWRNWDLLTATWVGLEISLSSCQQLDCSLWTSAPR